jgi:hypothetical protein
MGSHSSYCSFSPLSNLVIDKSKVHRKKIFSSKSKEEIVGSFMTAIPKEIVKSMEIKSGDRLLWIYTPSEKSTTLIKSPASKDGTVGLISTNNK